MTRAGATYCALRLRAHDDDLSVVTGTDLVPGLLALLRGTLDDADDSTARDTPDQHDEHDPQDLADRPDEESTR